MNEQRPGQPRQPLFDNVENRRVEFHADRFAQGIDLKNDAASLHAVGNEASKPFGGSGTDFHKNAVSQAGKRFHFRFRNHASIRPR
jgi:hypothetical protein